jgi:hypothetical protein
MRWKGEKEFAMATKLLKSNKSAAALGEVNRFNKTKLN